ncbi:MAG: alpha/beta fold hydrolase [Patescibacteria group bacterium]
MFLNFLFITFIVGAVVFFAAAWKVADGIIQSPRELRPDDWITAGLHPEFVQFQATDNVTLAGAFLPGSTRATVILLHGYGHSKTQLIPQAKLLHDAGFNTFLFDFRGSGESGGEFITFGEEETRDLAGAVRYVHTRQDVDHNRIGLLGYSMGGSVALLKSGDLHEIRAIVVDSSYAEFRSLIESNFKEYLGRLPFFPFGTLVLYIIKVRTGAYVEDVRPLRHMHTLQNIPILFIHGTKDRTVPVWDAMRLHAGATGPAELMVVEGAGHKGTFSDGIEKYSRKVVGFFNTHLLE